MYSHMPSATRASLPLAHVRRRARVGRELGQGRVPVGLHQGDRPVGERVERGLGLLVVERESVEGGETQVGTVVLGQVVAGEAGLITTIVFAGREQRQRVAPVTRRAGQL